MQMDKTRAECLRHSNVQFLPISKIKIISYETKTCVVILKTTSGAQINNTENISML